MATISSNLAMTLMAAGEQDDTWGTEQNNNLALLEDAIAEIYSITTTSGTVTLTAAQQANSILKVTATLVGNLVIETANTNVKNFMVWNNTSGAYSLTFRVITQTGITIPQGAAVWCRCNGTDIELVPLVGRGTEGSVASATATDIWTTGGTTKHITGTTTITSLGTAPAAGMWMKVIFDGALTLTDGANLNLPGGANITTAADDFAFVYAETTTLFKVLYFRVSGAPVAMSLGVAGTVFTADGEFLVGTGAGTGALESGATAAASMFNGAAVPAITAVATDKIMLQDADNSDALGADTITDVLALAHGQHTIWVPAGAMNAATTNGPSSGSIAIATSLIQISTLNFDGSAEEFAYFGIQMPKSWDAGTLFAQFIGSQTGATTNFGVAWGIEAVCVADDELLTGVSWGTEVVTTDTYGTTDDLFISGESTAITVGSTPAAEEVVFFRITRVVGDAGDTMTTADARLHGVKIHYTVNAGNDS